MSGASASQALRRRFESIRKGELQRLHRKLRGLTEDDRLSVETITADIVHALVRRPETALVIEESAATLEAVARLFALNE